MRDDLHEEISRYGAEVRRVAAQLIREGRAAPFEAIEKAHDIVQRERRQEAAEKVRRGDG